MGQELGLSTVLRDCICFCWLVDCFFQGEGSQSIDDEATVQSLFATGYETKVTIN